MKVQSTLKSLQVLHRTMLLGLVLFAAVAVYLKYTGSFSSSLAEKDQLLQLIAIGVSFACVFIGASIFKKKILKLRDSQLTIPEKSSTYRSASVIQWALLEAAAFFCVLCFLLVGNMAFLGLAAALLLWFALTAPSKIKIMLLLRLNEEEMERF